jgi:hypothetical protein
MDLKSWHQRLRYLKLGGASYIDSPISTVLRAAQVASLDTRPRHILDLLRTHHNALSRLRRLRCGHAPQEDIITILRAAPLLRVYDCMEVPFFEPSDCRYEGTTPPGSMELVLHFLRRIVYWDHEGPDESFLTQLRQLHFPRLRSIEAFD